MGQTSNLPCVAHDTIPNASANQLQTLPTLNSPRPSCTNSLTSSKSTSSDSDPESSAPYKIQNGVTGVYVSHSLVQSMRSFWERNVDCLSPEDHVEIGSSIYFSMMLSSKEMKCMLWNFASKDSTNIKRLGYRFLHWLGWLIRQLSTDNIDLKDLLSRLGVVHKALGINISHFAVMLTAVHETFGYYFEHKYTIKQRYAIDKMLTVSAELMMNQSMHTVQIMDDFVQSFESLTFLESISHCLHSKVGKEYFYRHLRKTICDELVIYLEAFRRYNAATSDKERFIIGRDICKTSIKSTAEFAINISDEAREATLAAMRQLQDQFFNPSNSEPLNVPITLFDQCHHEILRLISQNHWLQFKREITNLRNLV